MPNREQTLRTDPWNSPGQISLIAPSRKRTLVAVLNSSRWHVVLGLLLLAGSAFLRWLDRPGEVISAKQQTTYESSHAQQACQNCNIHEEILASNFSSLISASDDIKIIQLKDNFSPRVQGKKIVALAELKNVERAVSIFLRALSQFVDAIVLLDDKSSDRTRVLVMKLALSGLPVEILINKTGQWTREELRDRQLLLQFGREVGGTHFVLPDYDEFFSSNCVSNNFLRNHILALAPGESLFIPWVELWKSPSLQRVCPSDENMNFLKRRQTIIFADDGIAQYDDDTANSRSFNATPGRKESGERVSSIHALRCPRTICPQPIRYDGPMTPLTKNPRVKLLPECRIVELRFLNLANVLVKTAWYEALGRVFNAKDGVTSGKMAKLVLPSMTSVASATESVSVAYASDEWLFGYDFFNISSFAEVEMWRVHDLLKWRNEYGTARFLHLPAYQRIDFNALKSIADASTVPEKIFEHVHYVPRKLRRGAVVIVNDISEWRNDTALTALLEIFGGEVVRISENDIPTSHSVQSQRFPQGKYEERKEKLLAMINEAIALSRNDFAFFSTLNIDHELRMALMDFILREVSDLDVVVLLSTSHTSGTNPPRQETNEASFYQAVTTLAEKLGSHVRVLEVEKLFLSSMATISFLYERVTGYNALRRKELWQQNGIPDIKELVDFAETNYRALTRQLQRLGMSEKDRVPPVARLIFCLNVGRSGSKYFSELLDSVGPEGIVSLHEPACPDHFCSGGGAVSMQNRFRTRSYDDRRRVKLGMIREKLGEAAIVYGARVKQVDTSEIVVRYPLGSDALRQPLAGGSMREHGDIYIREISSRGISIHSLQELIYSESNPNFKSWFYDVVLDNLPEAGYSVDVVVLRKYIPATVKSLYKTGYFTARNGYNWMETANSVNAEIRPIDRDESLDAFDKLISYVINAEALTRKIVSNYSNRANFTEFRAERMYGSAGSLELLDRLKIVPKRNTLSMVGNKIDKYVNHGNTQDDVRLPEKHLSKTTLEECERRLAMYIERCKVLGIELPSAIVHMKPEPGFVYSKE